MRISLYSLWCEKEAVLSLFASTTSTFQLAIFSSKMGRIAVSPQESTHSSKRGIDNEFPFATGLRFAIIGLQAQFSILFRRKDNWCCLFRLGGFYDFQKQHIFNFYFFKFSGFLSSTEKSQMFRSCTFVKTFDTCFATLMWPRWSSYVDCKSKKKGQHVRELGVVCKIFSKYMSLFSPVLR